MENYLDVNMLKYKKYRTLFRTDPYNSAIYQYKMRKYGNRVVDALNTAAQTGGTSIQSIGDTYLTNLDIYNRIQNVNKLLKDVQTDIHHKKVNRECVEDFATFMKASNNFAKTTDEYNDTLVRSHGEIDTFVKKIDDDLDRIHTLLPP